MTSLEIGSFVPWLAESLLSNDDHLLEELVRARNASGRSLEEVALEIGVEPETLEEFESYVADPPLSVIRRYALAVDALVSHNVQDAFSVWRSGTHNCPETVYTAVGKNSAGIHQASFVFKAEGVELVTAYKDADFDLQISYSQHNQSHQSDVAAAVR